MRQEVHLPTLFTSWTEKMLQEATWELEDAEWHIPWDDARELHVRHVRVRKRFLSPGMSHLGCTNTNAGCCLLVKAQKGRWYNNKTTRTSWALVVHPSSNRSNEYGVYRLDSPGTKRPLRAHLADVYPSSPQIFQCLIFVKTRWPSLTSLFFPAVCVCVFPLLSKLAHGTASLMAKSISIPRSFSNMRDTSFLVQPQHTGRPKSSKNIANEFQVSTSVTV